jgi:hypothetical protein
MKSLKQHLFEYGYVPNQYAVEMNEHASDVAYQELTAKYGEDNVWDYRILDKAFECNNANFSYGIMFGVVNRKTGVRGSLFQTGTTVGIPRFYYNFQKMS